MNQTFLDLYPRLIQPNNTSMHLCGLWLAHGDESLMTQWLTQALIHQWRAQGQNIKRIELKSAKSWLEVVAELDSLSLFDPASAIIVTGNHKPDKQIQTYLSEFALRVQDIQSSNPQEIQNHLLWITPKQDKRALSGKWSQAFSQYGLIIDCHLYNETQRQQLLHLHATQFGLTLTPEAWQLLMNHTQNHLLSAYQTLWRLSYLFIATADALVTISADDLQSAIVSEANYSVYDLSDAMLTGNATQVVTIIDRLKTTSESPIRVLWTISKDMQLLQQLLSGKSTKELGIWASKQRLYQSACNRLSLNQTQDWSERLFKCDCAIKGVIKQPVWELLLQTALIVSGVRLFK